MTSKHFRPLPDYQTLTDRWLQNYDNANYDTSLSAKVLKRTHALIERPFGPDDVFPEVLEVGAGTLAHLPFIRHKFDHYIASDFDQEVLNAASAHIGTRTNVELLKLDGRKLPFADDRFNRLIATHVLEHVTDPHLAVEEWARVVKPGGVVSIILPCDPGLAWRFGRHFGPRRSAEGAGLPYDYYMAREHINSIFNLRQILEYHFPRQKSIWWPLRIPLPDLNLIYAVNLYV